MSARTIEWPPGSGVTAEYDLAEQRVLRNLIEKAEAGDITVEQFRLETGTFHDLKALLGGVLIPDAMPEPVEMPSPNSPFQIPPTAAAQLDLGASQMTELPGESWEDMFQGP